MFVVAAGILARIDPLSWEVIPRIHFGPIPISPHGMASPSVISPVQS